MDKILDSEYAGQPRQDKLQSLPVMAGIRENRPQLASGHADPLQDQNPKDAPLIESEELPSVEQPPDWAPEQPQRVPRIGDFSIIPRPAQRYSGEAD